MNERFQCSLASIDRHESLAGTASVVRAWLLIEVRGAWGPRAIHDSELGDYVPPGWKDQLSQAGIRAICIRADHRRGSSDVRLFHVVCNRPGAGPDVATTTTVGSLADVLAATAGMTNRAAPPTWQPFDGRLVLVCTNGRHDQCCANLGRPVVRALRESRYADELWECSHIGGDRFAGNVVVLPDGLYFGRCQADTITGLLDGHAAGRLDLDHFRGRSSYAPAEQMVEHFVRHRFGLRGAKDVIVGRHDGSVFRVRTPSGLFDVEIERRMAAQYEPLTCKGPAEQDIAQFELVSITPLDAVDAGARS
ncbi:MAG TPA: sucrase ferredoxin [Ilumatobacteraceae bacterium]|nr:sucrase ferredoxin [Ilumatobacteraceae bacterium]